MPRRGKPSRFNFETIPVFGIARFKEDPRNALKSWLYERRDYDKRYMFSFLVTDLRTKEEQFYVIRFAYKGQMDAARDHARKTDFAGFPYKIAETINRIMSENAKLNRST